MLFHLTIAALIGFSTALRPTGARQLTQPQQGSGEENLWDRIDIHELDRQLAAWHGDQGISSTNDPSIGSEEISSRQGYGDIPRPIPPIHPHPTLPPGSVHPPHQGCLAPRGQFPSTRSCSHYLNCWDDVVVEQECPGGLLFNELISACDFEYNTYCAGRPGIPPKPELPPGAKVCPDPNGRYRSSTNCSEFYVCVYGKPVKYGCPKTLVYNEELGVCDYPFRVDCRGAAEPPRPLILPRPPTLPPQQPNYPPHQHPQEPHYPHPPQQPPQQPHYPPQQPPQQPHYPPQQPPQQPHYPPQQPPQQPHYPPQQPPQEPHHPHPPQQPPQQPHYPPQQPPQQPHYPPQQPPQQPHHPHPPHQPQYPAPPAQEPQYPPQQPSYGNPWLAARIDPDLWHQRPVASEFEIQQEEKKKQQLLAQQQGTSIGPLSLPQDDTPDKPLLMNPWGQVQAIPAALTKVPCRNGDVHRLTDSCSSVVVCRDGRPQLVQCPSPQTYDRVSDSCMDFPLAKC